MPSGKKTFEELGGALDEMEASAEAEIRTLTQTIVNESDRAVGVLGGELVSQRLAMLLRSYCRREATAAKRFVDPLFTGYGPLATFAARINVAYALGIISERDRIQLDLVRKIRNDFAHNPSPIDFADPNMVERLAALAGASESKNDADEEAKLIGRLVMTRRQLVDRLAFLAVLTRLAAQLDVCRVIIESGEDVRRYNEIVDAKALGGERQ